MSTYLRDSRALRYNAKKVSAWGKNGLGVDGRGEARRYVYAGSCQTRALVSLKTSNYVSYGWGHKLPDIIPPPPLSKMPWLPSIPPHPLPPPSHFQGKNKVLTEILGANGLFHTQSAVLIFKKLHFGDR